MHVTWINMDAGGEEGRSAVYVCVWVGKKMHVWVRRRDVNGLDAAGNGFMMMKLLCIALWVSIVNVFTQKMFYITKTQRLLNFSFLKDFNVLLVVIFCFMFFL